MTASCAEGLSAGASAAGVAMFEALQFNVQQLEKQLSGACKLSELHASSVLLVQIEIFLRTEGRETT